MGFMFIKLRICGHWVEFHIIWTNYISFPQGSKTSFLYLIEGSDNSHGISIGSPYESLIMSSTHPLLQFDNFSEFMYIWEVIPAIT